jgi:hypothetical protein
MTTAAKWSVVVIVLTIVVILVAAYILNFTDVILIDDSHLDDCISTCATP